ncbi:MAG: hypothetical protein HFJ96_07580 [Peptococcaceae bacterium]|jgi:hypothetical protein|nr:hypothetical protein [Peptococcaceae bacterium]
MPTERESLDIKKAMAYDLLQIIKKDMDKQYSKEELENLIDAYIRGLEQ